MSGFIKIKNFVLNVDTINTVSCLENEITVNFGDDYRRTFTYVDNDTAQEALNNIYKELTYLS